MAVTNDSSNWWDSPGEDPQVTDPKTTDPNTPSAPAPPPPMPSGPVTDPNDPRLTNGAFASDPDVLKYINDVQGYGAGGNYLGKGPVPAATPTPTPGPTPPPGPGGGAPPPSGTPPPSTNTPAPPLPIYQMMNSAATGTAGGPPAGVSGQLYDLLLQRAHQGEEIDQNDPNIRQQMDPYAASVERQRRDYLAQVAEKRGPMGSIEGERRLSAERAGQTTGLFQSQLIGREIQSRRDEIQQALTQLGSQMTADQQQALSKELGYLNSSVQKYGIDTGANISQQQINSGNDQFAQKFGLDSTNQANYWDAIRRGTIKG